MKYITTLLILFYSALLVAQEFPKEDFFAPYKYPRHYTYDGSYSLLEITTFIPTGNASYGGDFKIDDGTFKPGTSAVRINLGIGFGYLTAEKLTEFEKTPLEDGLFGENYIKDLREMPNFQFYPRIWIRILNPLNISIAGGPAAYADIHTTKGRFTTYTDVYGSDEMQLDAKKVKYGVGYFYEAKLLLNFKNWGVSAGMAKYTLEYDLDMQPVVGFWFGLNGFNPVVN
jgi:hypothetical protein